MDRPEPGKTSGPALTFMSNKVLIGHEEGETPDLAPLFANNVEIFVVGSDFYLDIGIIKPEELIQAAQAAESKGHDLQTLNFFVLQRVAMSQQTLINLVSRGSKILNAMQAQRDAARPTGAGL